MCTKLNEPNSIKKGAELKYIGNGVGWKAVKLYGAILKGNEMLRSVGWGGGGCGSSDYNVMMMRGGCTW